MATITDNKTGANASNVYLFKNGYGMIVKTFEFPSNKGNNNKPVELIDPPSNPVHGTFWIQSFSNNTLIKSIRTKKTHTFIDKECTTVEDLVQANIGQDVQLLVIDDITKNKEWISGKIKSVKRGQGQPSESENTTDAMDTDLILSDHAMLYSHPHSVPAPIAASHSTITEVNNLVLLETNDNGLLALTLSDIRSIRSLTLKTTYQRKIFKNCLSIDYQNNSESNDKGLMKYLTHGITWAPSYNLVLLSSKDPSIKKLRLSSKAVILNDIENMNVENLYCIVGFPNVSKFASVIDPMISGVNVKDFLNQLKQCEIQHQQSRYYYNNQQSIMSNSIMTQQISAPTLSSNDNGFDFDINNQQDTNVDDLHLYEFKNILLEKKERLMLPIFDIEINYKDVYHCKIDTSQMENIYSRYNEKKQYEEVWHSVEFENLSNFVWTTAPIVITKDEREQQFIGQDTLTYTLKGSTTFVNLTKALDIQIQLDEKVINTNTNRFKIFNYHYQTEQIEGKIIISNHKSEDIVVVINLSLQGKISNYSIVPKKDSVKVNENVANQQHDIQWKIDIKSKQTIEIKYIRLYNKRV